MRPEITSGKIYGLELATAPGWRCPWGTVLGAGVCPLLVRLWWLAVGVGLTSVFFSWVQRECPTSALSLC